MSEVKQVFVTVTMTPLELKLFRRALAKAADQDILDRTLALRRICELDLLRWDAEDRAEEAAKQIEKANRPVRRVPRAA
jgi:hypothetical protein